MQREGVSNDMMPYLGLSWQGDDSLREEWQAHPGYDFTRETWAPDGPVPLVQWIFECPPAQHVPLHNYYTCGVSKLLCC